MVKNMKRNEIKETREVVVRTEYIAEDGQVFYDADECKKYEESALFAISKQLKPITNKDYVSQYDINDDCSDEYKVEIFNAENDKDIEVIRRYVYLKASSEHKYPIPKSDVDLPNITSGHEVMIFWNYDRDCCWSYGDGSINAYCNHIRENIMSVIKPKTEENTNA